jgi:hypothetical protein
LVVLGAAPAAACGSSPCGYTYQYRAAHSPCCHNTGLLYWVQQVATQRDFLAPTYAPYRWRHHHWWTYQRPYYGPRYRTAYRPFMHRPYFRPHLRPWLRPHVGPYFRPHVRPFVRPYRVHRLAVGPAHRSHMVRPHMVRPHTAGPRMAPRGPRHHR